MLNRMCNLFPARALEAFDEIHAGILITDHQSRAVHANRHFCDMLGLTPSALMELDPRTFVEMHRQDVQADHAQQSVHCDLTVNGVMCSIVIATAEISPDLLMSVIQDVQRIMTQHAGIQAELLALREELRELVATEAIPMCMTCHRVRLRDGSWVSAADPDALMRTGPISHGFCPPCAEEYCRKVRSTLS